MNKVNIRGVSGDVVKSTRSEIYPRRTHTHTLEYNIIIIFFYSAGGGRFDDWILNSAIAYFFGR